MKQIESQIDVLNEDFRRTNADATQTPAEFRGVASDVKIRFKLAPTDPKGFSTSGVVRVQVSKKSFDVDINNDGRIDLTEEKAAGIKFASIGSAAWPTDRYLNIWVCKLNKGLLGYAQFPFDFTTKPNTDGVVIETTVFGRVGNNLQTQYNKGRTATHEVGHWLNLRHIWGDASCGDDKVADTPKQETSTDCFYGCPSHPRPSCGSNDMFQNYMDYTDDRLMNLFTNGQKARMRKLFGPGGVRASLLEPLPQPIVLGFGGGSQIAPKPKLPALPPKISSIDEIAGSQTDNIVLLNTGGTSVTWSASPNVSIVSSSNLWATIRTRPSHAPRMPGSQLPYTLVKC